MKNPELAISACGRHFPFFCQKYFFNLNPVYSICAHTLFLNSQPLKEKVGLPNGHCFLLAAHSTSDPISWVLWIFICCLTDTINGFSPSVPQKSSVHLCKPLLPRQTEFLCMLYSINLFNKWNSNITMPVGWRLKDVQKLMEKTEGKRSMICLGSPQQPMAGWKNESLPRPWGTLQL